MVKLRDFDVVFLLGIDCLSLSSHSLRYIYVCTMEPIIFSSDYFFLNRSVIAMCGLLKFTKGNAIINNKCIFGIVVAEIRIHAYLKILC